MTEADPAPSGGAASPEPAHLSVVRYPGWSDGLRAYRILVDGEEVGSVRVGKTLRVAVEPGTRTVEARIDWCASRPVTAVFAPGRVVTLQVYPGLEGLSVFLAPVFLLFRRREYLKLERVSGGGRPPQRPAD